ncbi:hypothetical protein K8I61_05750 [bacterium]|nr:hypothetical protein [bacterium]
MIRASLQRRVAAVVLPIVALIGINVFVTLTDGPGVRGFPHPNQLTALHKYMGFTEEVLRASDNQFSVDTQNNNWRFSVAYAASSAVAAIAGPSVRTMRLSGQIFLVAIYFAALAIGRKRLALLDRVIVATAVASTPVVMSMSRVIEGHNVHALILLLAAGWLDRGDEPNARRPAWPLYFLPAVDALMAHTFTNFVIAMMSFAAIYLVYLVQIARIAPSLALRREAPWIAAGAVAAVTAIVVRFGVDRLAIMIPYYGIEMDLPPETGTSTSFFLYPEELFFVALGVGLTLAALPAASKRFRFGGFWMYVAWALVPLVALGFVSKKQNYYIWYAAPALAIIAGRVLGRLPGAFRALAPMLLILLAVARQIGDISPLADFVERDKFLFKIYHNPDGRSHLATGEVSRLAEAINGQAKACGIPVRDLLVFGDIPETSLATLRFRLQVLHPDTLLWGIRASKMGYPDRLVAAEIHNPDAVAAANLSVDDQAGRTQVLERLSQTHEKRRSGTMISVWCARGTDAAPPGTPHAAIFRSPRAEGDV